MKRLIICLASVCLFSGCLPADDTRVADLSANERERVCKRSTYEEITCDNGKEYDAFTESECIKQLERIAGSSCVFTVEDLDDLTSDPCSEAAERARTVASSFNCIFAL